MLRRAWPLLALALFTAVMLYPQWLRLDSVPDHGDPLFSMWRIGWVYRQLAGDPRDLFDANIFHPERLTFAYSDSMLLPALAAAPLLALGVHPAVTYNLLFIASFWLSAAAMFLLVRDLTESRGAAFISGLIFGFYPFRFEHYSHLELQISFWMPLALLCLHRFARTARMGWAIGAAGFAAAQIYSSMYLALFFACYVLRRGRAGVPSSHTLERADAGCDLRCGLDDHRRASTRARVLGQRGGGRRASGRRGGLLQRRTARLPACPASERDVGRPNAGGPHGRTAAPSW